MDPILVVNAGSSSLKFQVFAIEGSSELTLQIKGQVDGIGTQPRLRARAPGGIDAVDQSYERSEVPDVPAAIADGRRLAARALRHHARSRSATASCMADRDYDRPVLVDAGVLDEPRAIRSARAAASAEQSGADPLAARALARTCRRSRVSTPPFIAATARSPITMPCRSSFYAEGVRRYGFHGLSYEYIAQRLPRGRAGDRARARDRRASGQRRFDVRAGRRPQHREHDGLHGARRIADGNAAGPARSRRGALSDRAEGHERRGRAATCSITRAA